MGRTSKAVSRSWHCVATISHVWLYPAVGTSSFCTILGKFSVFSLVLFLRIQEKCRIVSLPWGCLICHLSQTWPQGEALPHSVFLILFLLTIDPHGDISPVGTLALWFQELSLHFSIYQPLFSNEKSVGNKTSTKQSAIQMICSFQMFVLLIICPKCDFFWCLAEGFLILLLQTELLDKVDRCQQNWGDRPFPNLHCFQAAAVEINQSTQGKETQWYHTQWKREWDFMTVLSSYRHVERH